MNGNNNHKQPQRNGDYLGKQRLSTTIAQLEKEMDPLQVKVALEERLNHKYWGNQI